MATERQILANRKNTLKSTGPRTAAGKARSRTNSTRHGLTSVTERSSPATSLDVVDLCDRLARIDAETARLVVKIRASEQQGHVDAIAVDLRRLPALQRYASRCYSALRRNEDEPNNQPFDKTNPVRDGQGLSFQGGESQTAKRY